MKKLFPPFFFCPDNLYAFFLGGGRDFRVKVLGLSIFSSRNSMHFVDFFFVSNKASALGIGAGCSGFLSFFFENLGQRHLLNYYYCSITVYLYIYI